jgi:hypothetical protein
MSLVEQHDSRLGGRQLRQSTFQLPAQMQLGNRVVPLSPSVQSSSAAELHTT